MANWKRIVAEQNRKAFQWPAGWDTREDIAEQLECSPERVAEILAPAIRAGEVERASFPIWEPATQRKIMVVGYRQKSAKPDLVKPAQQKGKQGRPKQANAWPFAVGSKVCRMETPHLHGTMLEGGRIHWETTGKVATPTGSSVKKIRLV